MCEPVETSQTQPLLQVCVRANCVHVLCRLVDPVFWVIDVSLDYRWHRKFLGFQPVEVHFKVHVVVETKVEYVPIRIKYFELRNI